MSDNKLFFSAFMMNTPSHSIHGFWKTPESENYRMDSLSYWTEAAKEIEALGFDLMMFADATGIRPLWNGSNEIHAKEGLHFPVGDPSVLMSAIAAVTESIGMVYTSSIIQDPPFDFARRISTLDHLTNGRIGWNIVTSATDNAYRNFGYDALLTHEERYGMADEYLDVLYKLWEGSWEDGALRKDKIEGVYADPALIHRINHEGKYYRVEGPHLVGPSPQRTPFLFQAGSSPVGQRFAMKHAEATFIQSPSPAAAKGLIDEGRKLVVENGRDARDIKFFQGLSFIIGDTPEDAKAKEAAHGATVNSAATVAHALGDVGVDAGGYSMDTPLSELGETKGVLGYLRWAQEQSGNSEPTIADLAWVMEGANRIVGTPEQIADQLEEWHDAGVDGVNVYTTHRPGSFRELGTKVFPILRERGLLSEGKPASLRGLFSGGDPLLPASHPAAQYRGAFTENSLITKYEV
jgi:FMN-dependent oxidoreductase (nitrilotriacetate monooxygenase family)